MGFKALVFTCLVAAINAQHQSVPHSHAQITLNKASTQRDTIHDTSAYHKVEYQHVAPVIQHYAPSQHQYLSSNGHSANGQQASYSQSSHQIASVQHVAPVVQVAPVAHYAVPASQGSHSHSSVSQSHSSSSAQYAPIAKVAYAAPVAKVAYAAPIAKVAYAAPITKVAYAAPVAKLAYAAPVAKVAYTAPVAKLAYATPVAKYVAAPSYHHEEEEYGPAEYSFEYSVHDEHTGDIKSQKETRHGDHVEGSYMLIEPDGSRRIVEYTSDKHAGFNAVVHREEINHSVTPVKAAIVAPVAVKYALPLHGYHH